MVAIFVKGYRFFINYDNLFRFLKGLNINLESELRRLRIPTERIDTRPLWKKSMDIQMGKKVDLRNPSNYPFRDENYLRRILLSK